MSFYDLDLEKLDKMEQAEEPGKPETYSSVAQEIDQVYRVAPFYQQRMAYVWMQNIHFLLGDQHIYYNQISRQFELLPTTRHNDFVPRPSTNLIQPITSTMVSNLIRNKPNADVIPNSPNEKDISAARLAKKIQDVKWEDDNEQEKLSEAALWAIVCGTVFRKDYWDSSYGKIVRIPMMETMQKPYLDEMGQMQFSTEEKPVFDEKGSPMFDEIPLGDNAVEIIDPFRIIVDPNASSEDSMNWIMETSIQKLFWIRENFDKEGNGYTGFAKDVKEEQSLSTLLQLSQRLKTISVKGSGGYAGSSGGHETSIKGAAIVKELYIRPTKNHPKGQMIISAGGKILYQGNSPYYDGAPNSWNPYTVFRYETIPGRFWGKSLLEDLIEPQRRINAIDSLIIYNRKTMVSPQRLVPHGSGVPEGYWNGAPGLQIQYRPVGANGAKPEIIPGIPLPGTVYQEREVTKSELYQIARTNEVLQGIRPTGVNTYAGLQLLLEQSFSTFAPTIQRWEKFIEKGTTKKLKLIAHFYREPRPEFINKLRSLNKDISDIEIVNFIGADLRDNCSVRIEAGSTIPRSNAAQQQQLMDLAKTGVLGDLVNDPVGKQKFLERLGVRGFDVNSEVDVKRAQWENEMLDNGNLESILVLPFENHTIHKTIHMNRMKEPMFMSLPSQLKQAYQQHVDQHDAILQQQQMQMAQQNALMQGNLPGAMAPGMEQKAAGLSPEAEGQVPPEFVQ